MNFLSRLGAAHQAHWQQPGVKESTRSAILLALLAVGCLVPAGLAFAGKINMYSNYLITRGWNPLMAPITFTILGSMSAISATAPTIKLLAGLKSQYKQVEV